MNIYKTNADATKYFVGYYNGSQLYPEGSIENAHLGSLESYYIAGFNDLLAANKFYNEFYLYSAITYAFNTETEKYIYQDRTKENKQLDNLMNTYLKRIKIVNFYLCDKVK